MWLQGIAETAEAAGGAEPAEWSGGTERDR
jgi:hypothetical protein